MPRDRLDDLALLGMLADEANAVYDRVEVVAVVTIEHVFAAATVNTVVALATIDMMSLPLPLPAI